MFHQPPSCAIRQGLSHPATRRNSRRVGGLANRRAALFSQLDNDLTAVRRRTLARHKPLPLHVLENTGDGRRTDVVSRVKYV